MVRSSLGCAEFSTFTPLVSHSSCHVRGRNRWAEPASCVSDLQRALDTRLTGTDGHWVDLRTENPSKNGTGPCERKLNDFHHRSSVTVGRWVHHPAANYGLQETTALSAAEVRAALAGKTIIFFGDSYMRIVMLAMLAVLTGRPVDGTYVTLGDNRSHPLATCRLSPRPSDCLQPANTNYKTNGIGFNITACGWPAVKRQDIADEQITLLHQVRTLYQMGDEYERVSFGRLTDGALQPAEPAGYLEPWPQPDLLLLSEGVWGPLFAPSSQLAQHQYSATPPFLRDAPM